MTYHSSPNIYVDFIHLKVEDITRALEFYGDIMGFGILERTEGMAVLTADGINPIIRLEQPKGVIPKIPRRTGLYHFAILLPEAKDLGIFLKHIRSKEYPITGGANHGVSMAVYLEDPDDNGIEIYVDTHSSSWNWKEENIEMTNKPLDYNQLILDAGGAEWAGIPVNTIIGHIHLHVADLKEAKEFYVDGLGFDLVMEMRDSALFLSSGGYHHHVGLNTWNGKGANPLPDNSVGMKYFSIMFPDNQERLNTIHKLKTLGYTTFEKKDKIFIKDPSLNLIQLK
ncbi:MAG: VOC family protein [Tissierellia bacterium]|jgi:catechol 2,3-dioxygenase|nr:VOC family protein [Tissierellia bacterium]